MQCSVVADGQMGDRRSKHFSAATCSAIITTIYHKQIGSDRITSECVCVIVMVTITLIELWKKKNEDEEIEKEKENGQ